MCDVTLLTQQNALQTEADEVVNELKLHHILSTVGQPIRVGSSALGLMVWRDIDITVVCSKLNIADVVSLGSMLMMRSGVEELRFRNDSGSLKSDDDYPDGLYFGLKYKSNTGNWWKIDIWFVDEPEKQPDLAHIRTMPKRLNPELRDSILKIKSVWAHRVEYGKKVKSYDIYTAVLNDDVRTPDQFNEWLNKKWE